MIFGATERVNGINRPNFQTDRVVKVSANPTVSPVVKLKPKAKWSFDPAFSRVPKVKSVGSNISDMLSSPVKTVKAKKKVIKDVVTLKPKAQWDPLATPGAETDDVMLKVLRKKKKKKAEAVVQDYSDTVESLGVKLGLTKKKKKKKKKKLPTDAKVRNLSLEGLSNDEELDFLQNQLAKKLKAAAQEEGLEDSVFDVAAALAPYRETTTLTIKDRIRIAKNRLQAQKNKAAKPTFEELVAEGEKVEEARAQVKEAAVTVAPDTDDAISRLRKRDRKRIIADSKLNTKYVKVVPDNPNDTLDARMLATNAVDIPKATVTKMRNRVKDLTKTYSDFLRNEIVPHIIAFDSAMDYVSVILRDGLGRDDVGSDNKLHASLQWLLHSRMMDFFCSKLNMKVSKSQFDKVFADMLQAELGASRPFESNVVGMVRSKKQQSTTPAAGVKTSRKSASLH